MKIFAWGSSTTEGRYDARYGGWVNRLHILTMARYANQEPGVADVRNFGRGAQSILQILERFDNDISIYTHPYERRIGVFALGAFDSAVRSGATEPVVPLMRFKASLGDLAQKSRDNRIRPVFMGLTPVSDNPLPGQQPHEQYRNAIRHEYDDAIRDFAEENDYPFIETYQPLEQAGYWLADGVISYDTIHPNTAGHEIIYQQAFAVLNPMLVPRPIEESELLDRIRDNVTGPAEFLNNS